MTVANDNEVGVDSSPGELLRAATRLFGELQGRNFACCDVNSATQCVILTTLVREGEQTLTSLARRLNLDKAWLSRSTDDLVAQGYLLKVPHPTDRRALHLHLTATGVQAAEDLDTQLNAQAARVLARFPVSERAQVLRVLAGLTQALQAELDGEEGGAC
ncbi:MarR family winged helix-turn-helix transcriptional regulator [Deinococcus aquaedulcis]|uniref:MarR family winged helix-turn-helix transcriptional regulator n=1 Tax=Deinococcus aquaedulcis TaxID=2840455 RepID=UPI001C834106|nr:MarR family transcriptional regulator [Deinococcus aquaedulcis]